MKTVRRLYFYLVALISLEVVLWGLINLLRSIIDQTVGGSADALAQALALIVVGVPIFLIHWLWIQRNSARDPEEKTAGLRAVFLYGILFGTLIPVIQNLLALIDRGFLQTLHLTAQRAIVGGLQTWPDNLIAILMNGIVALYFWYVLRREWRDLPEPDNFVGTRALYRYLWVLYSLFMMILGAQQVLSFIFFLPSELLGDVGRETMINGLALLVIGTPIWFYSWRTIQSALSGMTERESNLRLGFLYLLALGGVITVLTTTAMAIQIILARLLGTRMALADFVHQIGGPISVGLPLGVVWAYYGLWLNRHIESTGEPVRQAGMKRPYFYILSALGLGGALIGVASLVQFMIDQLVGGAFVLNDTLRSQLSSAISLIAAWLPLWLITWSSMQRQALAGGKAEKGISTETLQMMAEHARRSIIRRIYLYLALFAGVIGGMSSAVSLVFVLLQSLLSGHPGSDFVSTVLNDIQLLVWFSLLLIYHLLVMRQDGRSSADVLMKKQSTFKVLVVGPAEPFAQSVRAALNKYAPGVPVTVAAEKPAGEFNAMVLSGSLAFAPPDWIRSFKGSRVIVPDESQGTVWAGGVPNQVFQQAAQVIRQLAEGQTVRQKSVGGTSGWLIVVYIAAGLFGLELLLFLVSLIVSVFIR